MIKSLLSTRVHEYLSRIIRIFGIKHYVIRTVFNDRELRFTVPVENVEDAMRNFEHVVINRDYFRVKSALPRGGDTIVDAGAFLGFYTVLSGVLVGSSGRVYAFEPNRDIYPFLSLNIETNGVSCVKSYPVALCPWRGEGNLFIGENPAISSFNREHVEYFGDVVKSIPIKCVRFSSFLKFIRFADVLKLDVEGLEADLLREGKSELWRVDKIVVEVHTDTVDPTDVENILSEAGFSNLIVYASSEMPYQLIIYGFR